MPAVATAAGLPSRLGKYELLQPLAAGGMARIYIGRSTGIGSFERHVVLKMITPERASDVTAVNMFLDEARLAASLNHQNVAQVFEVGEETGIHYLAMEYVHGQDLRALLAKAGGQGTRIPLELALTVVAGAAAGLHHAHERRGHDGTPLGIVHRDVSPSNIMIGYDGAVKLLDFGIAKATARSVETQSGIIKGKFAYMAPEQCRGRGVDRRSDVFSLGIILYEVSTQHRCFRADSDFDTMHRIVTGDVVRPSRLVHGYPQALEAIVMKALAIDPAQRYQSAGLLLEALESFAVASRMSLSTMGLGRFMRDMFGEVQEPWLNSAAAKSFDEPIAAKENTISSTNGRSSDSHPRVQQATEPVDSSALIEEEDGRFQDSDKMEAMQTMLQLPGRDLLAEATPQPAWDPRHHGQSGAHPVHPHLTARTTPIGGIAQMPAVPAMAAAPAHVQPPPQDLAQTMPMGLTPAVPVAHGTQPLPNDFHPAPGSGQGPAIPAIASTKHGYASGAGITRGDVSYPRGSLPSFEPIGSAELQLKPNRRPLFIGLGIVILGVIVMLAVSLGGSKEAEPTASPSIDDEVESATGSAVDQPIVAPPTPGPGDEVIENMVSIVIHSQPSGADVLIAGAPIGKTPFEQKVKRGTKVQILTVRKEGYADFTGKIDLGGEYENKNIKLAPLDAAAGSGAGSAETGSAAAPADEQGAGSGSASSVSDVTTDPSSDTTSTERKAEPKTGTSTGTGSTSSTATTSTKTGSKTGTTSTSSSSSTKSGSGSKSGTGSKAGTGAKAKPKCQPPGPNVDPFGLPVCKT